VINADGTGLKNLVQVDKPCVADGKYENNEGNCVLDWPCGQWIYYEKPTKTTEIWRINVDDPSRNEKVCTYGVNLRRWDLSWDAKWSAYQSPQAGYNGPCRFPALTNKTGLTACNASISCSGTFVGHYFGGNHTLMCVTKFDPATGQRSSENNSNLGAYNEHTVEQIETWISDSLFTGGRGGADVIRWSVNSDKWALRQIGWCGQAADLDMGSNSVAVNWKEKQAINISHTPPPPDCRWPYEWETKHHSESADAGDLWIDFGPGNLYKWEDEQGQLHTIAPIDPTAIGAPSSPWQGIPRGALSLTPAKAGGMMITCSGSGRFSFAVTDARGRELIRASASKSAILDQRVLPAGIYIPEFHAIFVH
jgi:hypothetical protein